jgi:hypothetical protein
VVSTWPRVAPATAPGRTGNRTGFTDVADGATPTTVAYCNHNADRLTSTTTTQAPGSANPILSANLSASSIVYDAHGNTTTLADQTLTYDVADRHLSTTVVDITGATVVTYIRDATGRIVSRTVDAPGTTEDLTVRYSFAGSASPSALRRRCGRTRTCTATTSSPPTVPA